MDEQRDKLNNRLVKGWTEHSMSQGINKTIDAQRDELNKNEPMDELNNEWANWDELNNEWANWDELNIWWAKWWTEQLKSQSGWSRQ